MKDHEFAILWGQKSAMSDIRESKGERCVIPTSSIHLALPLGATHCLVTKPPCAPVPQGAKDQEVTVGIGGRR